MSEFISLEQLLAIPNAVETIRVHELPDGLGKVKIKALSLEEHRQMQEAATEGDEFDFDRWQILTMVYGVVEPPLTYDQAAKLRQKTVGVTGGLIDAIWALSGITPRGGISASAVEEAEASFRGRPGESVDVPPGEDAGEVGEGDPQDDESA